MRRVILRGLLFKIKIENKICEKLELSLNSAEPSQIQHYKVGNQFKAHHDFFHSDGDYEKFAGENSNYKGQRTWTFTIYLNDVDKGGATEFVKLNKSVTPKTGRAVIWNNLKPNGDLNYQTLHRGTPVEKRREVYCY